ncbi:Uncharacterised protein [Kluyvera cryocrescens]|nr:Uncharacterised protein [Kluyvera cryocrescens]
MHAHIFAINKLTAQRRERIAVLLNGRKYLFKSAHHKLALRVDFAQLGHYRENILLERHLVMTIRQQNLFSDRCFFQHVKIAIESFAQAGFILR